MRKINTFNKQKQPTFNAVPFTVQHNQLPVGSAALKPMNQEDIDEQGFEDWYFSGGEPQPAYPVQPMPPMQPIKLQQPPVEQTPIQEYYYDDYITDRVFYMRNIESNYDIPTTKAADILRKNNEIIMDEIDTMRRTEMATLMEYFTQQNLLILQTCRDAIEDIKDYLIMQNK